MNPPVQDLLTGVNPSLAGYGSVALIGVAALIVWRVARRIVQLGYFVMYFFMGFAIVYAASAYASKTLAVPMSMPIVGGLAFAAVASAIRAKLMRIVSAVMMVALFSLAGKYWTQYAGESAKPTAEQQQLAGKALQTARKEFADIAPFLPKEESGKIKEGFLSAAQLEKLGLEGELHKVTKERAWHTWLTGLFNQEQEDLGIWTPGGTLEQAKKGLKVKERP